MFDNEFGESLETCVAYVCVTWVLITWMTGC